MNKRFTPENIEKLNENEIFVFGSNLNGNHAGGAARVAVEKFGAVQGNGEGIQGNSYAIPTLDKEMNKVSLDVLKNSIFSFSDYAKENAGKTFFLTKIGCGIAGFNKFEIAKIVYECKLPENVIIPEEFQVTNTFKGTDKDMKCRNFQYEIDKVYYQEEDPVVCGNGFHSCKHPLGVLSFYPNINGNRYFKSVNFGKVSDDNSGDTKIASKNISLKCEIGISGLAKASVSYVKSVIDNCIKSPSTAGDKAHSSTAGNYAHSSTAGNYAHSSTAGENCISAGLGFKNKAKAALNSWIVLSEWKQDEDYNWYLSEVKSAKIDGEILKSDTWYALIDGEFKESDN